MADTLDNVISEAKAGAFPLQRKLNRSKVLKMREARREGAPVAAIARAAGVCPKTVHDVISGRTWGHVK